MNVKLKIRIWFIFLIFCSLYIVLILNLYSIQIKNRNFYIDLGERQYHAYLTIAPPRAVILDRNDQLLALNKDSFSAFIMPRAIQDIEKLKKFLEGYFPEVLNRLNKNLKKHFLFIKRKLTKKDLEIIKGANIKDVHILKEPNRFYPMECAGIITGITNVDNNGLFGVELMFDKELKGFPTKIALEKDARLGYFYFNKETIDKGKSGQAIKLTIDSDLQFLIYEELKERVKYFQAKEGAAIIMNPINGDILVMSSFPDFNPNDTSQLILENTKNKVLTECNELGSVMKIFTALAGLEEGIVSIDEKIDCGNAKSVLIDGVRINTLHAAGELSLSEIIETSNNIGIAKIAKRLGARLYDYYVKVGFGSKTKLNFLGEEKGFVNHPSNWSKLSIFSLSYGYEITASLLQLAKAMSIIGNDGKDVKPRLIFDASVNSNEASSPIFSKKSIDQIKIILENTVLRGTAKRARIKGYRIMAKTGTAHLVENGKYNPYKKIYVISAIIEKGEYKRVIAIYIKDCPKKRFLSQQVVVPLLEKIAEKVLIHDRII